MLALLYGGVPFTSREKVLQIGPIEATAEVKRTAQIPPLAGAGAVAVGTALLVIASFRRPKS